MKLTLECQVAQSQGQEGGGGGVLSRGCFLGRKVGGAGQPVGLTGLLSERPHRLHQGEGNPLAAQADLTSRYRVLTTQTVKSLCSRRSKEMRSHQPHTLPPGPVEAKRLSLK